MFGADDHVTSRKAEDSGPLAELLADVRLTSWVRTRRPASFGALVTDAPVNRCDGATSEREIFVRESPSPSIRVFTSRFDVAGRPRATIIAAPDFRDHESIYFGCRIRESSVGVDGEADDDVPVVGEDATAVVPDLALSIVFSDLIARRVLAVLAGVDEAPDGVRQDALGETAGVVSTSRMLVGSLARGPWVAATTARRANRRHDRLDDSQARRRGHMTAASSAAVLALVKCEPPRDELDPARPVPCS